MLMFSELIPGFMIAYITLIERFFPVLFSKAYGESNKVLMDQELTDFSDEELRLPDFASYLGFSTHQDSYYLNKHTSMKFADFLNMNRIEDIKRNLSNKFHMNLLQIALECGFNSASSFHRTCVKFTGKSPREFRKLINSDNENNFLIVIQCYLM